MFRVKICGITRIEDAASACDAGADAIGLNFYSGSKRCVSVAQARAIADAVSNRALRVGVFVNHSAAEIEAICRDVRLDAIQLHGDETPDSLSRLPHLPLLRAYRCGSAGLAPLAAYLQRCEELGTSLAAVLIDAHAPGQYGGSGQTVDWNALAEARHLLHGLPLILAGGLSADNVAEAIRAAQPAGVDVASGVESSPGVKDEKAVRALVAAARSAFEASRKMS